ncbi:MAG: hypothetical protein IJQ12_05330, partial [Lachnospiraceae bacterium]|nr:hypothetical protein [Lachnospiraceae bacterium]
LSRLNSFIALAMGFTLELSRICFAYMTSLGNSPASKTLRVSSVAGCRPMQSSKTALLCASTHRASFSACAWLIAFAKIQGCITVQFSRYSRLLYADSAHYYNICEYGCQPVFPYIFKKKTDGDGGI